MAKSIQGPAVLECWDISRSAGIFPSCYRQERLGGGNPALGSRAHPGTGASHGSSTSFPRRGPSPQTVAEILGPSWLPPAETRVTLVRATRPCCHWIPSGVPAAARPLAAFHGVPGAESKPLTPARLCLPSYRSGPTVARSPDRTSPPTDPLFGESSLSKSGEDTRPLGQRTLSVHRTSCGNQGDSGGVPSCGFSCGCCLAPQSLPGCRGMLVCHL